MDTDHLHELIRDSRGHELEIGLALGSLSDDDLERLGHGSLSEFLIEELLDPPATPGHSTVMRWVRAASVLDGPDDPRAAWGPSKLAVVERIPTTEREQFLEQHDVSSMTVRELNEAVGKLTGGKRRGPDVDEPHRVLERAINNYLRRHLPEEHGIEISASRGRGEEPKTTISVAAREVDRDAAAAMAAAGRVAGAIATSKAAWRRVTDYRRPPVPPCLSLEQIDRIPAGQLEAEWDDPDLVRISKGGQPILWLSVERPGHGETRMIQSAKSSNRKLRGVFGTIDTAAQGCLRRATGWPQCDEACFALPDVKVSGCYVIHTTWPNLPDNAGHDVISNGLLNGLLQVRIPANGSPDLSSRAGNLWRCSAETTDGALSISLGLFQRWAEANPDDRFMTICSHHFRPSDEMLAWLSGLRNAWVGTTTSAWLHEDELEVRFQSIERLLEWEIPSAVWIVTHETWDNDTILSRALELVEPEQIIEAPYRYGTGSQDLPVLGVNPLGSCSDHRVTVDHEGIEEHYGVVRNEASTGPDDRFQLVNELGREPRLPAHSKCEGCGLLCGLPVLEERRKAD